MFCTGYGIGGYGYGGFGFGGIFMMIGFLLILFLAIYLIYKAAQNRGNRDANTAVYNNISSRAIDILNERFAKGEIDAEEYKARKSQILNR